MTLEIYGLDKNNSIKFIKYLEAGSQGTIKQAEFLEQEASQLIVQAETTKGQKGINKLLDDAVSLLHEAFRLRTP